MAAKYDALATNKTHTISIGSLHYMPTLNGRITKLSGLNNRCKNHERDNISIDKYW